MAYVIISNVSFKYPNGSFNGSEHRQLISLEDLEYLKYIMKDYPKYKFNYYLDPHIINIFIHLFGEKSVINNDYETCPGNDLVKYFLSRFYNCYIPKILKEIHTDNCLLQQELDILKIYTRRKSRTLDEYNWNSLQNTIERILEIEEIKQLKIIPEIQNIIESYIVCYQKGYDYQIPLSSKNDTITISLEDERYIAEEEYIVAELYEQYPEIKNTIDIFAKSNNLSSNDIVYVSLHSNW